MHRIRPFTDPQSVDLLPNMAPCMDPSLPAEPEVPVNQFLCTSTTSGVNTNR